MDLMNICSSFLPFLHPLLSTILLSQSTPCPIPLCVCVCVCVCAHACACAFVCACAYRRSLGLTESVEFRRRVSLTVKFVSNVQALPSVSVSSDVIDSKLISPFLPNFAPIL